MPISRTNTVTPEEKKEGQISRSLNLLEDTTNCLFDRATNLIRLLVPVTSICTEQPVEAPDTNIKELKVQLAQRIDITTNKLRELIGSICVAENNLEL